MKSIIRQFRFSSAVDDGRTAADLKPLSQADQEFIRELAGVEQQLKSTPPCLAAPPELHDAIMEKVRRAEPAAMERRAATVGHDGAWGRVVAAFQRPSALWLGPASAALLVAALLTAVHFLRQ